MAAKWGKFEADRTGKKEEFFLLLRSPSFECCDDALPENKRILFDCFLIKILIFRQNSFLMMF